MRGKASKLRLFKCFTYCIKKRGRINFVLERLVEFEEKKNRERRDICVLGREALLRQGGGKKELFVNQ